MRLIDAEPIIKNLSAMKTQMGYDAIDIDGMIKALREAEGVTNSDSPNGPLTLEELRDMEGEPVWVEHYNGGEWITVHWDYSDKITTAYKACLRQQNYGKTWIAYRRKPEEDVITAQ